MVSKRLSVLVILTLSVMLIFTNGCTGVANNKGQSGAIIEKIQQALQSKLDNLDSDLGVAAVKLGGPGLSQTEARQILGNLCSKYPFLIDCLTADVSGRVTAAAPETYQKYEGDSISINNIKKATFTNSFRAVEGIDAVSLMRPVLAQKGELMGIISALFKPQVMIASIAGPVVEGTGIELSVAQLDGLIIYNSEGDDLGTNLITNPVYQQYKELVEVHKQVISRESGTGSYSYPSHKTGAQVHKIADWSTVKLHDTAWRLITYQEAVK